MRLETNMKIRGWLSSFALLALAGCLACGGSSASSRSPQAPTLTATAAYTIVHAPRLDPPTTADTWEVLRGLYAGLEDQLPERRVHLSHGPIIGTLNQKGLFTPAPHFLLAHPDRVEAFARTHAVTAVFSRLSNAQLQSPQGQALLHAHRFVDKGLLYAHDKHAVYRPIEAQERRPPTPLANAGLMVDPADQARDLQLFRFPYDQLPDRYRAQADPIVAYFRESLGFFIKKGDSTGPALGGILARLRPSTSYGTGLYVENFWVAPELRGRGYGKILMDNVVNWAREHRVQVISLDTNQGLSYPFYERYGFVRHFTLPDAVALANGGSHEAYEYILKAENFPRDLRLAP